ncbi:MAG: ATP-binding protein [Myxococcota bacterium]|nr:ATP-binding protein [Myxococcota bacterium]
MDKNPPVAQSKAMSGPLGLEMDHLYRFAGVVGSNLDEDTLLEDALSQLVIMARAERILVVLAPADRPERNTIKHRGWPTPPEVRFSPEEIEALGIDALSGVGLRELPLPLARAYPDLQMAWVIVPLHAYGRHLGLMFLLRSKKAYDASTLKFLNTAGRQLAIAAENSRLFGDLQSSYRRLIDAQEELIRQERLAALGGLAATMAHEIRNPLATIFSSLSQIRKHAHMVGDVATLLEIAEEEALRLNRMVGGLLEFARPQTPRPGEVWPAEMVRNIVSAIEREGEFPAGVAVDTNKCREDILAHLDPELFRQSMYHLVTNAVAAVDPGHGRIIVSLATTGDDNADLVVTVQDNGPGIAPELQPSIFEPFFSTKPSGSGLGLPVVKRIVEDHGGSIDLSSEPGNGTEFRLLFKGAVHKGDENGVEK